MADDLLIQPLVIDPADFPPLPLQPGFTQLVSDELGNAATPLDGFDAVMADTIAIVDALDGALGGLAGELLDAFGEADTIDPQPVSDTVDGFTASLAPSDTAVGNLGTLLAGAATPTPPAAGGGAPPGSAGTFDFVAVGPIGASCKYTLTYTNNTGQTDTVEKFTLANDSAGVFAVAWPLPVTLANGQSVDVVVTVTATQVGEHTATFSTFTSNEAAPLVVQFKVNVLATSVQCQGPGPGPGPGTGVGGGRGIRK